MDNWVDQDDFCLEPLDHWYGTKVKKPIAHWRMNRINHSMHSLLGYITIPTARVVKGGKFGPYQMEKHPETRSTDYTANGTTEACIKMLGKRVTPKITMRTKLKRARFFLKWLLLPVMIITDISFTKIHFQPCGISKHFQALRAEIKTTLKSWVDRKICKCQPMMEYFNVIKAQRASWVWSVSSCETVEEKWREKIQIELQLGGI